MKELCCICGKTIVGYGHEAYPLKRGRCCNACNVQVIRKRIILSRQKDHDSKRPNHRAK